MRLCGPKRQEIKRWLEKESCTTNDFVIDFLRQILSGQLNQGYGAQGTQHAWKMTKNA
jgi:hypothetical protein